MADQHGAKARLLTIKDVAYRLDVSTTTIRRAIRGGKLLYHRVGRQVRITESQLQTFLAGERK